MRNIREIRTLSISELTDDEILKAAVYRIGYKAAILMYKSPDNGHMVMLGRYRSGAYSILTHIKKTLEAEFGKFNKFEEDI